MSEATVPLAVPSITEREIERVTEAVRSGFVSSVGPFVGEFERKFADVVGTRHAVACASGTAALHLAFAALDIPRGAEVVVSDFTFVGSANPIAYIGARPLLVDSDRETWNLDEDLLVDHLEERLRTGRPLPAAVETVHVLGQPARTERLLAFCTAHGIPLVEDAAESLGARWSGGTLKGRHTGTVGTVGAFSFNGNKIVTTGGGGMLVTDDEVIASRARHLSTQAKVPAVGYLHDEVGYNYRLTNVAAALGVAQLERLDELVARRRAVAERYDDAFASGPLTTPPRIEGYDSTYWLYSVLVPSHAGRDVRDALLEHLQRAGIGARPLWRPLHAQPPWADVARLGGDVANDLFERGLSLPCSFELSDDEQSRVIESVLDFLKSV
jgi:dTDP-4-amino-4,6-dideoxygalactose transaminase